MQKMVLHAKVLGLVLLAAFTPIAAIAMAVESFSFWPFSPLQTAALAFVGGACFAWYLMHKMYEDNYLTITYYPAQKRRILISSPVRKPYVIIQELQGGRWVTRDRCDLAALPLSPEDQEKLATFLECIPSQDNLRQRSLDYILKQFSHEPFTQLYMSMMGGTQSTA
jgi:hypothetical protein